MVCMTSSITSLRLSDSLGSWSLQDRTSLRSSSVRLFSLYRPVLLRLVVTILRLQPLCSASPRNSWTNPSRPLTASVRLWYGHAILGSRLILRCLVHRSRLLLRLRFSSTSLNTSIQSRPVCYSLADWPNLSRHGTSLCVGSGLNRLLISWTRWQVSSTRTL